MAGGEVESTATGRMISIIGYMLCSSLMLLANKLAIFYLGAPKFVLFAQLAGTAVVIVMARAAGIITRPIYTSWKTALAFAPAPIAFLGTLFSNIKVLQYANVETFIVFRASTPLLISVADYVWMDRELPNKRSVVCLLVILMGAVLYVKSDADFHVSGYTWVMVWYAIFSIDQLYIKYIINKTKKKMTTWGRVFVTNAIGACIMGPLVLMGDEPAKLGALDWTSTPRVSWFLVSIAIGVCMGYFAMSARTAVSSTYFTVIGNQIINL
jgi:GDP-mannose transporter